MFRVRPNGRGLNASDVAKNIEKIKDRLKGVEITSVGVGDKVSRNQLVFKIAIRTITEIEILEIFHHLDSIIKRVITTKSIFDVSIFYNVDIGFVRL